MLAFLCPLCAVCPFCSCPLRRALSVKGSFSGLAGRARGRARRSRTSSNIGGNLARRRWENASARMRGTVLLLQNDRSWDVDVDLLRANGLVVVDQCHEVVDALKRCQSISPDVVVAVVSARDSQSIVPDLRGEIDHATSIIVVSVPEEREAARRAGADSFLLNSTPLADLLFEIKRALILRRSGRRLPWNG